MLENVAGVIYAARHGIFRTSEVGAQFRGKMLNFATAPLGVGTASDVKQTLISVCDIG